MRGIDSRGHTIMMVPYKLLTIAIMYISTQSDPGVQKADWQYSLLVPSCACMALAREPPISPVEKLNFPNPANAKQGCGLPSSHQTLALPHFGKWLTLVLRLLHQRRASPMRVASPSSGNICSLILKKSARSDFAICWIRVRS